MDHRRVRTSRLPPLSRREKPCLRAGGCWGGFAGGELFRVGRYVSTGAGEVVRDFERKMRHCVRGCSFSQPLVLSKTLFGNCGQVLSQEALSFRKLSGRHVLRSRARSGLRVLAGAACHPTRQCEETLYVSLCGELSCDSKLKITQHLVTQTQDHTAPRNSNSRSHRHHRLKPDSSESRHALSRISHASSVLQTAPGILPL